MRDFSLIFIRAGNRVSQLSAIFALLYCVVPGT
jgi:hypothetical protein